MIGFDGRFTLDAENGLLRLSDFLIEHDFSAADHLQTTIAKAREMLQVFPFS